MLAGVITRAEQPRRFEHDIDFQIFPGQLRRIPLGHHEHLVAVDDQAILLGLNTAAIAPVHRVVAEQVRQSFGVRQIVHRDEIEIGPPSIPLRGTHYHSSDPTEAVDAHTYGHVEPTSVTWVSTLRTH